MHYQIEIKQIVDFPRVRIYRDFIRTLITEKGIRTSGSYCFPHLEKIRRKQSDHTDHL